MGYFPYLFTGHAVVSKVSNCCRGGVIPARGSDHDRSNPFYLACEPVLLFRGAVPGGHQLCSGRG